MFRRWRLPYLEKTIDNLPPYITLMDGKQLGFEKLIGAARDGILALEIFLYSLISSCLFTSSELDCQPL